MKTPGGKWEEVEPPGEDGRRRCVCIQCGFISAPTASRLDRIYHRCKAPRGAGDVVAEWIDGVFRVTGITKPDCGGGCDKRKKWINDAGEAAVKWINGVLHIRPRGE